MRVYPWHTDITATVFWIGEPKGGGSSEDNAVSAYDDAWLEHYGGFDEYRLRRVAPKYWPPFKPKQNPFYLDLPFDDINNKAAHAARMLVVPWVKGRKDPGPNISVMKNRWVCLRKGAIICYAQIEDAGPYVYDDAAYVFGKGDARPRSQRANNAGMDVSPAVRDYLQFKDLNGDSDKVDWQFVDTVNVPTGAWKRIITRSQVYQP